MTLWLAACNLPAPGASTPDLAPTFIAATVQGLRTQAATAPPTLALPTQAPATAEPTQAPVASATPTATQSATPADGDCDQVEFVADVTVEDDSVFDPGESFTKTWRLRNSGTCTWTTSYALAFIDGRKMGGPDVKPLASSVAPGQTADVSVQLVAPSATGTHRGNWMLRNAEGENFGLGEDADRPFWVQIVVGEADEDGDDLPDLGEPDWRDNFNSAANWYEFETDDHRFEIEDGDMVMTALKSSTDDYWGLATVPDLEDFYLEITATTGSSCGGLDRYGVLIRAPNADNGYVYAFSCNGRYRIYRWDGEFTALRNWTVSSAIHSGPDQTNRLGIWAEGDTFRLYANGELLDTVSDDEFDEGRFGLFIGAAQTANFRVFVDRASYWLLD
jgi:hypothetical protein